jgi:hypothetical protein
LTPDPEILNGDRIEFDILSFGPPEKQATRQHRNKGMKSYR